MELVSLYSLCTIPLELNTSFVLFGDWSLARMTEAAHKREGVPRCKGHAVVSYLWTGCVLCVSFTHTTLVIDTLTLHAQFQLILTLSTSCMAPGPGPPSGFIPHRTPASFGLHHRDTPPPTVKTSRVKVALRWSPRTNTQIAGCAHLGACEYVVKRAAVKEHSQAIRRPTHVPAAAT